MSIRCANALLNVHSTICLFFFRMFCLMFCFMLCHHNTKKNKVFRMLCLKVCSNTLPVEHLKSVFNVMPNVLLNVRHFVFIEYFAKQSTRIDFDFAKYSTRIDFDTLCFECFPVFSECSTQCSAECSSSRILKTY